MFWYSFDDAGVLLETERSVFLNHIVLCIFSGILPDLLFQDIQRVEIRWCPFHLSQKQTNRLFKCSFVCYPHVCRIRLYYAISLNRIHNCRESHIFPKIQNIVLKENGSTIWKFPHFPAYFNNISFHLIYYGYGQLFVAVLLFPSRSKGDPPGGLCTPAQGQGEGPVGYKFPR